MTKRTGDRIPSPAECYELMAQQDMLPHIVEHSVQVMNVSLVIADNLRSGVHINRDLVLAAALLHDITKTRSIRTREHHDASGGALLRELAFRDTAYIVEQHVFIQNLNIEGRLDEREIVYYADKRVLHDTIVTLEERVIDLIKRYGATEEIRTQILVNKVQALAVERKIASFMAIDLHRALRKTAALKSNREWSPWQQTMPAT